MHSTIGCGEPGTANFCLQIDKDQPIKITPKPDSRKSYAVGVPATQPLLINVNEVGYNVAEKHYKPTVILNCYMFELLDWYIVDHIQVI